MKLPIATLSLVGGVIFLWVTLAHGQDTYIQGDVDCNGAVNAVDALKILRHSAALIVTQNDPCADIGTSDYAPTPTSSSWSSTPIPESPSPTADVPTPTATIALTASATPAVTVTPSPQPWPTPTASPVPLPDWVGCEVLDWGQCVDGGSYGTFYTSVCYTWPFTVSAQSTHELRFDLGIQANNVEASIGCDGSTDFLATGLNETTYVVSDEHTGPNFNVSFKLRNPVGVQDPIPYYLDFVAVR